MLLHTKIVCSIKIVYSRAVIYRNSDVRTVQLFFDAVIKCDNQTSLVSYHSALSGNVSPVHHLCRHQCRYHASPVSRSLTGICRRIGA